MASARRGKVGNLPLDLTSFVGRRREVTETRRLLAGSRLVTLTGIGGVGKTRLALRVAAESQRAFDDGVWLVEFGERRDQQLVAETVAATLGLREQASVPTTQILTDYLGPRNALLILDNCEHVIDHVSKLVETLLRTSPDLRILATSREPLAIGGETVLRVPPLTFPVPDRSTTVKSLTQYEAVNLFIERAAAAVPGFELTEDNRAAIIEICSELDGLPLAIELAAARLRALSVDQVAARLTDRFRLLTGGMRGAPSRQQTLQMSIDWSNDLCTTTEQELWRRLSVFAHGFELDAAEAIAGDDLTPLGLLDLVTSLVDKSILIREENEGVIRYRLLEILRDYGLERLREADEDRELRRLHRDWYQALVTRAEAEWIGPNQPERIARIGRERANLRDALVYCTTEPGEAANGLRIVNGLFLFWISRGLLTEGRLWIDRVLAAPDGELTPLRAKALAAATLLAANQGDIETGRALITQAYDIADQLGDRDTDIVVAHAAGHLAIYAGDLPEALMVLDGVLDQVRDGEDLLRRITTLLGLAMTCVALGEPAKAGEYTDEVLAITEAHGESLYRSYALCSRGLAIWNHDPDQARPLFERALRLSGAVDDLLGAAICVEALAWIAAAKAEYQRSAVLLGAVRALWESVGNRGIVIPAFRENHDDTEDRVRRALGDRSFDATERQGAGLALDETVTFAIDDELPQEASPDRSATDLTPREQEVADLVAQGLTNKAIADQLVISQRTVQGHVEHVLAKLGFNSRTQIAAWVVEQGRQSDTDAV
ncbi:ATP-binding protein [Rhodococcus sp. ACT016]|uniref:ATP-binding protein n=1 Tax=Rhodococcus sp. ACT016 TaxID=3134808 RepID=UPI003D2684B5